MCVYREDPSTSTVSSYNMFALDPYKPTKFHPKELEMDVQKCTPTWEVSEPSTHGQYSRRINTAALIPTSLSLTHLSGGSKVQPSSYRQPKSFWTSSKLHV